MENRINVVLTPENKDTVFQAIGSVKTGLPFLIKLSKNERNGIQKVDDARKPFVEKAIDSATHDANLNPAPGTTMLALAPNDVDLYGFLVTVENDLNQLLESVRDTKQLAGAEAYKVARLVYDKAKMNVKLDVPGSQAIADELGKLYKQKSSAVKASAAK